MNTWQTTQARWFVRSAAVICAVMLALPALADWKQAVAYYQQGQFEKAIQELKPDLDKNPDWEFGHRLAGLCYLGLKNNALAISELSRAVQLQSKEFATFRALAQAYLYTDKLDNCIQSLNQGEQFAKQPADLYDLHHFRGAAYYRQQKYREAADDLTAAIRIKSSDWVDFSQLGIAYFNLNRYDEALQMMQKALALKPGEPITSGFLGKAYFKQGVVALANKQYDQAADLLRKAATYSPNDGYVFYNAAEAYLFSNNYAEAEKAYNQALGLLPKNADIYIRLAFLYEKQKKWDQALTAYQKAIDLNPAPAVQADLYQRVGMVYENQKKWDQALSFYQKAVAQNPPTPVIIALHQRLGAVYENQKNWEQALVVYQKATELNPPPALKAEILQRLGMIYEGQNKWDQALGAYQKASTLRPSPALKEAIARVTEQKKK